MHVSCLVRISIETQWKALTIEHALVFTFQLTTVLFTQRFNCQKMLNIYKYILIMTLSVVNTCSDCNNIDITPVRIDFWHGKQDDWLCAAQVILLNASRYRIYNNHLFICTDIWSMYCNVRLGWSQTLDYLNVGDMRLLLSHLQTWWRSKYQVFIITVS